MLLVYSGAHPEVVVDELDSELVIKAGEPTEIPDDLSARLLEQNTWSQAKPAPTPPTPSVSTPAGTDEKASS
jgi:hypothetical protein